VDGTWWETPEQSFTVDAHYPPVPLARCSPPEPAIVSLVRAGNSQVLKLLEQHCKPYPTSPIGPDAFQAACFEWAIAAAQQPVRRSQLTDLCVEISRRSGDVRRSSEDEDLAPGGDELHPRLVAELRERSHRLVKEEPLFGVHEATWLVACLIVWRSLGRPSFLLIPEHELVEYAVALQNLAPALLAHDLIKVCAIEALLAFKRHHVTGPSPTHE
jgi:hypothetical protein